MFPSRIVSPVSRPGGSRRLVVGAAAGLTMLLAGCSSSTASVTATTTSDPLVGKECCVVPSYGAAEVVNGIETVHNGWDNYVVSWLAPHDAVAGQMAELAPAQAESQAVKDIAAEIDAQTAPRYLQLSAMAGAWSQPIPSTDPNDAVGHDHGGGVSEAGTAETLLPLTGTAFDKEFLTIMIAHHQAGLPIAEQTIADGQNTQAKQLAQNLIDVQTPEIATMQSLLAAMP